MPCFSCEVSVWKDGYVKVYFTMLENVQPLYIDGRRIIMVYTIDAEEGDD